MSYLRGLAMLARDAALFPLKQALRPAIQAQPPIAQFDFVWGKEFCQISAHLAPSGLSHDAALVSSYLSFLYRYFYICEANQVPILRAFLSTRLGGLTSGFRSHSIALFRSILKASGPGAEDAAEKLFQGSPPGASGYSEAAVPGTVVAKYSLRVTTDFRSLFEMSSGPDTILLPQLVLVFYKYVAERLERPEFRQLLDQLIAQVLESHDRWNPRAMETMVNGPRTLLRELGLVS